MVGGVKDTNGKNGWTIGDDQNEADLELQDEHDFEKLVQCFVQIGHTGVL